MSTEKLASEELAHWREKTIKKVKTGGLVPDEVITTPPSLHPSPPSLEPGDDKGERGRSRHHRQNHQEVHIQRRSGN